MDRQETLDRWRVIALPIPVATPFTSLLGAGVRWRSGHATVDHYLERRRVVLVSTPLLDLQSPDDLRAYADHLNAIADAMKQERI